MIATWRVFLKSVSLSILELQRKEYSGGLKFENLSHDGQVFVQLNEWVQFHSDLDLANTLVAKSLMWIL